MDAEAELAERKALIRDSQAKQAPSSQSPSRVDGIWCRSVRHSVAPLEMRETSLLREEMEVFDDLGETSEFKRWRTFTHRKVPAAFSERLGMLQLELMQTQLETQFEVVQRRAEIVLCHLARLPRSTLPPPYM